MPAMTKISWIKREGAEHLGAPGLADGRTPFFSLRPTPLCNFCASSLWIIPALVNMKKVRKIDRSKRKLYAHLGRLPKGFEMPTLSCDSAKFLLVSRAKFQRKTW